MICWILGIIVYLVIAYFTYEKLVKNWNNPKWENIMMSLSWICIIPCYVVYWINKNYHISE